MSEITEEAWDRERAVAALARMQLCPRYRMPCWVCIALHNLTGTLRSVAAGRFERFKEMHAHLTSDHVTHWLESAYLVCPHHPGAKSPNYLHRYGGAHDDYRRRDASLYWATEEASAIQ